MVILGGFFYLELPSYARFIYDKLSLNHRIKIFSQTINLTLIGGSIMLIIILLFEQKFQTYCLDLMNILYILFYTCGSILGFL